MERLGLVPRDDDLDVGDRGPRAAPIRGASVSALEVAAHARAQRLRLPHVQRPRPARRGTGTRPACAEAPRSVPSRFSRIPSLAYPHAPSAPGGARGRFRARRGLAAPADGEAGPGWWSAPSRTTSALVEPRRGGDADGALPRLRLPRGARHELLAPRASCADRATSYASSRTSATAAARNGVRVYVTVMHPGSRTTPLTDEARARVRRLRRPRSSGAVPGVRHVIVGNEPNLNRFWLPQFALDGSNAASAGAISSCSAETYDALKAVSPNVRVYGGALSPRGSDRAGGTRPTHSPTKFIQDLGVAYRASGRDRPVMDAFVIHPYGDNSSQPPTLRATQLNTTIGDRRLRQARRAPRRGVRRDRAARLRPPDPLRRVRRRVPDPGRQGGPVHGNEPAMTRPVPRRRRPPYYEQALALAFCQPTVEGMLIFLSRDERARPSWQSGVYYVDGTREGEPVPGHRVARPDDGRLDRALPGRPAHRPADASSASQAVRREAGHVRDEAPLQPRLRLRRAGGERASTDSTKLSSRGGARSESSPRSTSARGRLARGHVPLHAASRAPGRTRRRRRCAGPAVPPAVTCARGGSGECRPRPRRPLKPAARAAGRHGAPTRFVSSAPCATHARPRAHSGEHEDQRERVAAGDPSRAPARWPPPPG